MHNNCIQASILTLDKYRCFLMHKMYIKPRCHMGCNSNFMYRGYMTFTVKFPVEDRAKCQVPKTCRIHTFPLHILHIQTSCIHYISFMLPGVVSCTFYVLPKLMIEWYCYFQVSCHCASRDLNQVHSSMASVYLSIATSWNFGWSWPRGLYNCPL